MRRFIDYYKLLDISKTASKEEIKKAYRTFAKEYHPDNLDENLDPEERRQKENKFKRINRVYAILMNDEKRQKYDQKYQKYYSEEDSQNSSKTVMVNLKETQQEQKNTQEEIVLDNLYSRVMHVNNEKEIDSNLQEPKKEDYSSQENIDNTERLFIFKEGIPTLLSNIKLKRNPRKVIKGALVVGTVFFLGLATIKISAMIDDLIENLTKQEQEEYIPTTTIIRNYQVQLGDTLSQLAEDANCTQQEIKWKNNKKDNSLYYKETIQIPYHIPTDQLYKYTTTNLYQGENIEEYAAQYETTVDSLAKLNTDTMINVDGEYIITSDTLTTPTFEKYEYQKPAQNRKK